jgi:MATE family multidrug resistance protein
MAPRNTLSADAAEYQSPFGRSFTSSSPIAASIIARDLARYEDEESIDTNETSDSSTVRPSSRRPSSSYAGTNPHSLAGSYRRPSYFTSVNHSTVIPSNGEYQPLTQNELEDAIEQERQLLSDNNVIPPEDAHGKPQGLQHKLSSLFSTSPQEGSSKYYGSIRRPSGPDAETGVVATESSALLGAPRGEGDAMGPEEIDRKWEEAVTAGLINTTWQREARVIGRYSAPLMVTFLLQYSLTVASIFTIGHLGKEELGAVSLASMTVSITGNAVYSGLATSLDTLCAQAYGSGKRKLVGLQMLRMVFFLWLVTIPIAILWYFSEHILAKIVPEKEVAQMAGLYLKVALLGTPGFACFESGKRYLQAQGVFSASLYVLLVCAPLNAFMNWFFVWVSSKFPHLEKR